MFKRVKNGYISFLIKDIDKKSIEDSVIQYEIVGDCPISTKYIIRKDKSLLIGDVPTYLLHTYDCPNIAIKYIQEHPDEINEFIETSCERNNTKTITALIKHFDVSLSNKMIHDLIFYRSLDVLVMIIKEFNIEHIRATYDILNLHCFEFLKQLAQYVRIIIDIKDIQKIIDRYPVYNEYIQSPNIEIIEH